MRVKTFKSARIGLIALLACMLALTVGMVAAGGGGFKARAATIGTGTNVNTFINPSNAADAAYDAAKSSNDWNGNGEISNGANLAEATDAEYLVYKATFPAGAENAYLRISIQSMTTDGAIVRLSADPETLATAVPATIAFNGAHPNADVSLNYYSLASFIPDTGDVTVYARFENAKLHRIRFLSSNLDAVGSFADDGRKLDDHGDGLAGKPTFTTAIAGDTYVVAPSGDDMSLKALAQQTKFFDFDGGNYEWHRCYMNGGGTYQDNGNFFAKLITVPANSSGRLSLTVSSDGAPSNARFIMRNVKDNSIVYDLSSSGTDSKNDFNEFDLTGTRTDRATSFEVNGGFSGYIFQLPVATAEETYYVQCTSAIMDGRGMQVRSSVYISSKENNVLNVSDMGVAGKFSRTYGNVRADFDTTDSIYRKGDDLKAPDFEIGGWEMDSVAVYKFDYDAAKDGTDHFFIRLNLGIRWALSVKDKDGINFYFAMVPSAMSAGHGLAQENRFSVDIASLPGGIAQYLCDDGNGGKQIVLRIENIMKGKAGWGTRIHEIERVWHVNGANVLTVAAGGNSELVDPQDESKIHTVLGTGLATEGGRYADYGDYFVYNAQFSGNYKNAVKYVDFDLAKDNLLAGSWVSTDNANWVPVYVKLNEEVTDNTTTLESGLLRYELNDLLKDSTDGKVYFKVGSSAMGNNGGHLNSIQFFSEAKSANADASTIRVGSETLDLSVFTSENSFTYTYPTALALGATALPTISAIAADIDNAVVVITPDFANLNTKIVITAADGTTVKTYTIRFTRTAASANSNASGITLDGKALTGFDKATKEYSITLDKGATLPVVAATCEDALASAVVTQATDTNKTATVVITAADGTKTTYTITFKISDGTDKKSGGCGSVIGSNGLSIFGLLVGLVALCAIIFKRRASHK